MTRARWKVNWGKKRNILIMLASMVLTLSLKSQDVLTYKYFVGTTEPDANWKTLEFDDSSWPQGYGSIGYGDNDDSTVITAAPSVYIRYHLRLNSDYKHYEGIVIYPDFDDGFIAYLNNVEIFRVNIASSVENPTHLQTTNRSHEAQSLLTGGPQLYNMPGYYIDSMQLAACAVDTLNMLAFAVYSDSVNGSDLTFGFYYTIIDTLSYNDHIDLNFIEKPESDSTQLPYIVIETNEFGIYDSSVIASMGIINNPSEHYNCLTDTFTDYNGRIRVRLHGTYSLQFPKKSLRIELQDSIGDNNNVSILGLPAENDFILYAPFQDKTLIKNVFTYNLGRKMGYYEPRTRFCELVLNGYDLGLHVLVEKIKRDKNRVNITKLSSEDNSGVGLTGGYILEYNHGLEIVYPKEDDITPEQTNYINNFMSTCENLIQDINYCSTENTYKDYIDINSLADYFIISELSMNYDAFAKSWYMYKDNNEVDVRLKYGPLWDYDVAWYYYRGQGVEAWWTYDSPILSIASILRDTSFVHFLINRWNNYREGILSNEAIFGLIDSITTAIAPAIERNYQIWPVAGFTEYGQYVGITYQDWIDETKAWIEGRLSWIDRNIRYLDYEPNCNPSYIDYPLSEKGIGILSCYPNPFINELNLQVFAAYPCDIKVSIYDLAGIELYAESFAVTGGSNPLKMSIGTQVVPGFYTLIITQGNEIVYTQKIIKVN